MVAATDLKIKGSVAVVTGAARGIGRAVALELARRGARVVLCDVDDDAGRATAREVETYGHGVLYVHCDVGNAGAVASLKEQVELAFGPTDILINNAGVAIAGDVTTLSMDDWHWQLGPNLFGVIHGISTFLPGMLQRGQGHIVNVASLFGLMGAANLVAYSTSKFAIVGLSEALRFEVASKGVGVTVVCPGFVKTGLLNSARFRGGASEPPWAKFLSMSAQDLAKKVVEAILENKKEVIAPGHARFLLWVRRFPSLWDFLGRKVSQHIT